MTRWPLRSDSVTSSPRSLVSVKSGAASPGLRMVVTTSNLVRAEGGTRTRTPRHRNLNPACLPVPPLPQGGPVYECRTLRDVHLDGVPASRAVRVGRSVLFRLRGPGRVGRADPDLVGTRGRRPHQHPLSPRVDGRLGREGGLLPRTV